MTRTDFIIKAVRGLDRAEAEAWWDAVMGDRVARSGLVGWVPARRTALAWLEVADQPDVDMNVVYGADGTRLAYFWVSDIRGHFGLLHFNFFSWALPRAVAVGKFVLKTLWSAGYLCLMGLTPRHLRNAVAYARAVGGVVVCEWPGVCYWADKNVWEDGVMTQFLPGCENN